jgi:hypothetical protein
VRTLPSAPCGRWLSTWRRVAAEAELVAAARNWRTGAQFDERFAVDLLGRQLVPLYVHYIDDHINRLGALDRDDLAKALDDRRKRLIA